MTDDQDLEGLDPYDLMDSRRRRASIGFFSTLDDAGWQAPSRCEGWSVRDVLAHLTASEDYNRACLDGTVSTFLGELGARGVTDLDGANELGIRDLDDVATPELLETWRTRASREPRGVPRPRRWRCRQLGRCVPGRWQAFHLAFELATHADDVGVPVDSRRGRRAPHWQAKFGRFALKETKPDVADGRVTTAGRACTARTSTSSSPTPSSCQAAAATPPGRQPRSTRDAGAYLSVTP